MNFLGNRDGKEPTLPPEFFHLQETLDKAKEQIGYLNEQIEKIPKDKGLFPAPTPPGFARLDQPGNYNKIIEGLEQRKAEIKADTIKKIEKEISHSDLKVAQRVRDTMRETFDPNPYLEMDATTLQENKTQIKDLQTSQNFSDALLKEGSKPDPQEKKTSSFSARFSQSLNYTQAVEKADSSLEKTDLSPEPNPTPQKDHIDIDRD